MKIVTFNGWALYKPGIIAMSDKEKPKPKTPEPSIPICPACNQNMIHCKCKHNDLKK